MDYGIFEQSKRRDKLQESMLHVVRSNLLELMLLAEETLYGPLSPEYRAAIKEAYRCR